MQLLVTVLCPIFIQIFVLVQAQSKGTGCKIIGTQERGICLHIIECDEALKNIKSKQPIQKCGFEGNVPIVCCRFAGMPISTRKCHEYYPPHFEDEFPPPAVVGGIPAELKEFPHMVALGFGPDNNIQWQCGGTLISEKYVLTAAHCLFSRDLGQVRKAMMGTIDLARPNTGYPQVLDVKNATRHPQYSSSNKYHDLALIELKNTFGFNDAVNVACLNRKFDIFDNVTRLTAIGWGKTEFIGPQSNNLLKVDLVPVQTNLCRKSYDEDLNLPDGIVESLQICASGREGEIKDTCQGDSGGPLEYEKDDKHFVVGVTSFGRACGIAHTPGVYTRVSNYVDWIENIVWK